MRLRRLRRLGVPNPATQAVIELKDSQTEESIQTGSQDDAKIESCPAIIPSNFYF